MDEVQVSTESFPNQGAAAWIDAYQEEILTTKDEATIEAYARILEKFAAWLSLRPGNSGQFRPQAMTRTAIAGFLETLPSFSYKKQARAALSGFCRWLQEDQQLLERNPVRGVSISAQALLAPRELSKDQRYVIRDLVEREADLRGKAAFALGYIAGCRVSDVSWLLLDSVQVSREAGWITVGHKGGKERTIDLMNEARRPLYEYLQQGERKGECLRLYQPACEKARERGRDRRMALDGGWHPPMVAATQSEGAPCRSQVHQRHRFPRSPSRFCAPGTGSRLESGRGGLLPGVYYQKRDASHSNDYSVHAGEP
jgi:integrase